MAERPTKKRAASASTSSRKRAPAARTAPEVAVETSAREAMTSAREVETSALEPELKLSANYALRLTEGLDDVDAAQVGTSRKGWSSGRARRSPDASTVNAPRSRAAGGGAASPLAESGAVGDSFALRLNEALNAIAAAEGSAEPASVEPIAQTAAAERRSSFAERASVAPSSEGVDKVAPGVVAASSERIDEGACGARAAASWTSGVAKWLASLDKLPPIRLPFGPAIPWRLGLPALLVVFAVTLIVGRPTSRADAQTVHLPAQDTYAVQQEAPLFANSAQSQQSQAQPRPAPPAAQQNDARAQTQPAPPAAPASEPIGVQDPGGMGFDILDLGLKLAAVVGLAYGSLMLLKRVGVGGVPGLGKTSGPLQGVQVISSTALAPNRSVHVIRVPGGRTLLVGSTPSAVNLLADLGAPASTEEF